MDHRKIMALGKSSLVISLPKTWLKTNNLSRGESVFLDIQKNGSLVVRPTLTGEELREKYLSIQANESGDSIIRRIIGAYLDGYTTIKLTSEIFFTVEQQKAIRRIVGTLYMMIMESETSNIILKALVDESKASVTSGIERMHYITYSMCRDSLNSMKNKDIDLARTVISIEDDVDQMMFFLLRLIRGAAYSPSLANQLGLDSLDCLDFQTIVHRIERIADHATSIAEAIIAMLESKIETPGEITAILLKAAKRVFDSYDTAVQSFLFKDISQCNDIIDNQKEVEELFSKITPLPTFGQGDESSTLSHIITIRESIKKISHYSGDIAELTINRTYKSQRL